MHTHTHTRTQNCWRKITHCQNREGFFFRHINTESINTQMCAVKSNCIRTQQPTKHYTYNKQMTIHPTHYQNERFAVTTATSQSQMKRSLNFNRIDKTNCDALTSTSTQPILMGSCILHSCLFFFCLAILFILVFTALFSVGIISLKKIGCVITYYFHLLNTNTDSNWLRWMRAAHPGYHLQFIYLRVFFSIFLFRFYAALSRLD